MSNNIQCLVFFDSVYVFESERANNFSWQPLLKVNNTENYFIHKLNMSLCMPNFALELILVTNCSHIRLH